MSNSTIDSHPEEFANTLTHGGGLLLAVAGAALLLNTAAQEATHTVFFGCGIYAITLVSVYAASTLSHLFRQPARRHFFRSIDQGVIFLFMAGNFTPVAIAILQDKPWWMLLPVMWILAFIGFCSKVIWVHRVDCIAVWHYLALGWFPITAMWPIWQSLPLGGNLWCLAGGLCYTVGTFFLLFDTKYRFFHSIWHLLVIAGSVCHFIVVFHYVIPLK